MSLRRPPIESLTVDDLRFAVRWSARRRTVGITVKRDGELIRGRARRAPPRAGSKPSCARSCPGCGASSPSSRRSGRRPSPGRSSPASCSPTSAASTGWSSPTGRPTPVALDGDALRGRPGARRRRARRRRRLVRGAGARVHRRRRRALRTARRRRPGRGRRPRPGQAALGRLRPPHPDRELPLAADHAAARAGRLRGRARAGPPARAQPRGGRSGGGSRTCMPDCKERRKRLSRRGDQLAF